MTRFDYNRRILKRTCPELFEYVSGKDSVSMHRFEIFMIDNFINEYDHIDACCGIRGNDDDNYYRYRMILLMELVRYNIDVIRFKLL